jgi:chemotaxis protein methyltransferase CheR
MIAFKPHNLLDGPGALGRFDVILCRNVLIYFTLDLKRAVLEQLARALTPDGALFLGSAESVLGVTDALVASPEARGIFRPATALATAPANLAGLGRP